MRENKNAQTNFIIAGKDLCGGRKNLQTLQDALLWLSRKNLDFKITIIGKIAQNVRDTLDSKHISFLGYVDYKTLYEKIEAADFLLPMLDAANTAHDRYLIDTSGSFQLVYGFKIPPLVSEKFAKRYFLNTANAIIYRDNVCENTKNIYAQNPKNLGSSDILADLGCAMEFAIKQTNDNHNKMRAALAKSAKEIYQHSLENLKATIESK